MSEESTTAYSIPKIPLCPFAHTYIVTLNPFLYITSQTHPIISPFLTQSLPSYSPHSLPSPHTSPTPCLPPLMHTVPPTLGVLCPVPIPPLDGEVSWSSNEVGAVLHYYCREGFDLVGTASQGCLPIGEWSSYTPLCMKGESVGGDACMCACVVMFKVLITQQCQ